MEDFSAATMLSGFRRRTCRLLRTPKYFEDTPQLTITDDPCGHRNTILVDAVCSVVVMVSTRQLLPVRMLCSIAKPSTRLVAFSTVLRLTMRLRVTWSTLLVGTRCTFARISRTMPRTVFDCAKVLFLRQWLLLYARRSVGQRVVCRFC